MFSQYLGGAETSSAENSVDAGNLRGLDKNIRSFVHEELTDPLDIDAIVAPAVREETAMDRTGAAEQAYLALLAARLNLAPGLVKHLHANVETAIPRA